jgi:hypothetical protein
MDIAWSPRLRPEVATTFAIAGTSASGRVLRANDRVRIAIAGINGRGQAHITGFGGMKDVEIAYLVDPDSRSARMHEQTRHPNSIFVLRHSFQEMPHVKR